jgi:prepilin-type N-terminal cleavage/methylation domain-containing protein
MRKPFPPGFTLVELLTVIAIIALLIGILVPSLAAARNQARNASTASLVKTLESGCEQFRNENKGAYPRSGGKNPLETMYPYLMGAQWLAMQLCGPDLQGYVQPTLENDFAPAGGKGDGKIDHTDWVAWYDPNQAVKYARVGPYVPTDGKHIKNVWQYESEQLAAGPAPEGLKLGATEWKNENLPFFIDAHGYPVLYYRANARAPQAISTGSGATLKLGIYDQSHNGYFTGYDVSPAPGEMALTDNREGWDLGGTGAFKAGKVVVHPLGFLGYDASKPTEWPEEHTFASYVLDRKVFDSTKVGKDGRLVPFHADRFLLISAGRDGLYGTNDDIRSFNN